MAYFNKIGLLILNDEQNKFMVCEKNNYTSDFIMPGGQIEPGEDDKTCLIREIEEELSAKTDIDSPVYIDEYIDVAAGDPTKDVSIKLFSGKILNDPVPSQEVIKFHWIGKDDADNSRVSPIIKNKIIPDLVPKGLLK